jgi:hypothetical protein
VLDAAIWAIQLMRGFDGAKCLPKRVSATGGIYWLDDAKEVPDTQIVSYDYGDMMLNFELRSFATDYLMPHSAPRIGPKSAGGPADFATAYYGTDATVLALNDRWEVHWKDGKVEQTKAGGGSHEANFLEAVKRRKKPNADVEIGRLSTMLCHLGNVSYNWDATCASTRRRRNSETPKPTSCCAKSIARDTSCRKCRVRADAFPKRVSGNCGCRRGAGYLLRFAGDPRYGDGLERVLHCTILGSIEPSDNGGGVPERLIQNIVYPNRDELELRVDVPKAVDFAIHLRLPGWLSGAAAVRVNGRSVDVAAERKTFATVRRRWQKNDTVVVQLPVPRPDGGDRRPS